MVGAASSVRQWHRAIGFQRRKLVDDLLLPAGNSEEGDRDFSGENGRMSSESGQGLSAARNLHEM